MRFCFLLSLAILTSSVCSLHAGSVEGQITAETATPTPSVTVSPTITPTPWVVYSTATPGPLVGDAKIPGNLFRPLSGAPLKLNFYVPFAGKVNISLYNRQGVRIKSFEKERGAGESSESWDGRADDGALVPAGIYAAHFRGNGLNKTVKLVVIK
ncbi:MAG: FlgD immunoglobulin-like domain containing protein [candidate division FCPU426 bacterium]